MVGFVRFAHGTAALLLPSSIPPDVDLVTFDVFDTLILRVVQDPRDIFEVMASRRPDLLGTGFRRARIEAEALARVAAAPAEDITLASIYDQMVASGALSGADAPTALALEVETEVSSVVRREDVASFLDRLVALGTKVALVSDMYLPASVIGRMLTRCGIVGHRLYVSNEIGRTKASGSLFDHVSSSESVGFGRWLHVGDNPWSDVSRPRRMGIRTIHVPLDEEPAHDLADGILRRCSTVVSLDHPQASDADAFWQRVGCDLAMPMVVGLCAEVRRVATERDCRSILFLARDGAIIKKAYEALYPDDARHTAYLLASRRVVNFASIFDLDPAAIKFLNGGKDHMTVAELLGRVGIRDASVVGRAEAASGHVGTNPPAGALKAAFDSCKAELMDAASRERQVLTEYLRSVGMDKGGRVLLVDVGWFCSIQRSLARIAESEGWSTEILGAYVGTKSEAYAGDRGLHAYGWLYQGDRPVAARVEVDRCTELVELLFSAPEHGIVGIEKVGQAFVPVRAVIAAEETRIFVAARLHDAVSRSVELLRAGGCLDLCAGLAPLVLGRLRDFVAHPDETRAEYLIPVRHSLGFGASRYRQIVPDRVPWRDPVQVLRALLSAHWREGFVASSPRRIRPVLKVAVAYGIPVYRLGWKLRSRLSAVRRRVQARRA